MNFRSRPREEPEINLIPFIDVLLVVLIFLMLSTTYSKFTELQVALPVADADAARDRPAEIIVAICRDMIARSLSATRSEKPGIEISRCSPPVLTSLIEIAAMPMVRRRLATAAWLLASIRPLTTLPVLSRTAYSNCFVAVAISVLRPWPGSRRGSTR